MAQPDFRHPRTGKPYSGYIDVPSFIDHNLMTVCSRTSTACACRPTSTRTAGGPLVAGPVWDFDRSSGTRYDARLLTARAPASRASGRAATAPTRCSGASGRRLFADPAFKAAHTRAGPSWRAAPSPSTNLHR